MSLAPAAYLLFQKYLRHDPSDAKWLGRDRFVLSAGHSSLTLYIQLFLSGYGLELSDLEAFRTWGSLTPGHPEYGHTVGVETTTGPLGQGPREEEEEETDDFRRRRRRRNGRAPSSRSVLTGSSR